MVTSPEEMTRYNPEELKKYEKRIDELLSSEYISDDGNVCVVVEGEPNKALRQQLETIYKEDGGWSKVITITSSENGERPGLMRMTLWV